jgi:homoserine kinase type II
VPEAPPHLGPIDEEETVDHDRFAAYELGVVLSNYDLGVIRRIRELHRGSRRAPKLRIMADRGEFLLKRRAPGRDDPNRVAFAHDLQLRLAEEKYPVPGLVPAHTSGRPMLRLNDHVYEMFHWVTGARDDKSVAAAEQAGRALGHLHRLLAGYRPVGSSPRGSYHAATGLDGALRRVPAMVAAIEPTAARDDLETLCRSLGEVYRDAARRADALGIAGWPDRIIHGDWHPGNLIYGKNGVRAVLDFDSSRVAPRVIDVANGALQFSMKMTDPERPDRWPERLDVERIRALLGGYDQASGEPLAVLERESLPWLMLEALILESVVPIATTGRFARISGMAFLRMVERKVTWLRPRAGRLAEFLA